VTRHTAKFVEFVPDNYHANTIRILPTSLTIILPPPATSTPPTPCPNKAPKQCITLHHATDDNHTRTPGQQEQDKIAYDNLAKTEKITVADGFVSFTRTFRYLGSLINYSLCDDDDITARIASPTAAMGALKELWRNHHLDIYNKYLLFRAIPMNLLPWGAKTWSLRKSQLDQLEVFLHRSIRRIFQISMSKVQEDRIRNEKVRRMFYSIPCARNMIAARQADFIGKLIQPPPRSTIAQHDHCML